MWWTVKRQIRSLQFLCLILAGFFNPQSDAMLKLIQTALHYPLMSLQMYTLMWCLNIDKILKIWNQMKNYLHLAAFGHITSLFSTGMSFIMVTTVLQIPTCNAYRPVAVAWSVRLPFWSILKYLNNFGLPWNFVKSVLFSAVLPTIACKTKIVNMLTIMPAKHQHVSIVIVSYPNLWINCQYIWKRYSCFSDFLLTLTLTLLIIQPRLKLFTYLVKHFNIYMLTCYGIDCPLRIKCWSPDFPKLFLWPNIWKMNYILISLSCTLLWVLISKD